jgi:hypothetical protein
MDGQHLLDVNLRKGGNKKEQWSKHIPLDNIMVAALTSSTQVV